MDVRYEHDERIVMTLDAGGTNFVFSAVQGNRLIVEPVRYPSNGSNLQQSLQTLRDGFTRILNRLPSAPVAVSIAFPGPADYENGVIGDLVNLPGYRGGVAVGPMLEDYFKLPVFINNDGDLFAYGEAIAGFLPEVNLWLQEAGNPKHYENLLGVTLGTGFGAGIVRRGELFLGDNSAGAEIWTFPNKFHPDMSAEETVSIRGVVKLYLERCRIPPGSAVSPRDIFAIACGDLPGDQEAALEAYRLFGQALGYALALASSLIDGLVVIGGGISGAASFFLPAAVAEMNGSLRLADGSQVRRTESVVFNLEDEKQREAFLADTGIEVLIPGTKRTCRYNPHKRVGVGLTRLGTERAIFVGAYAFALHELDGR
ncbi:MAG: ROK family protein [candidate division KSB1 bacterium]|nr:ROK family protein [candidate division KSB1 bacterium]